MIAANRRDHEQTTAPEPQPGFQGEGGRALRRPPQSGDGLEGTAGGASFRSFRLGKHGTSEPAVDVKSLHAKIGELTLENGF